MRHAGQKACDMRVRPFAFSPPPRPTWGQHRFAFSAKARRARLRVAAVRAVSCGIQVAEGYPALPPREAALPPPPSAAPHGSPGMTHTQDRLTFW